MNKATASRVGRATLAERLRRRGREALRLAADRLPVRMPPWWQGQLVALACAGFGTAVRAALEPITGGHIPVIVYYPCVLVAAVFGGSLAGVTTMLLGAAIGWTFWLAHDHQEVTLAAYALTCLFGVFMTALLRRLAETHLEGEQRALLLTNEVNHRANNLLSVVLAISAQTARASSSVAEYREAFESRVAAMARAQHVVAGAPGVSPLLGALVRNVVEPYGQDRFVVDGDDGSLPLELAPTCALLLHELCVNAAKHGALSTLEGRIAIGWRSDGARTTLDWRESGGPPVSGPVRAGFGSRLMDKAFAPGQGRASLSYDPEGVRCRIEIFGRA